MVRLCFFFYEPLVWLLPCGTLDYFFTIALEKPLIHSWIDIKIKSKLLSYQLDTFQRARAQFSRICECFEDAWRWPWVCMCVMHVCGDLEHNTQLMVSKHLTGMTWKTFQDKTNAGKEFLQWRGDKRETLALGLLVLLPLYLSACFLSYLGSQ